MPPGLVGGSRRLPGLGKRWQLCLASPWACCTLVAAHWGVILDTHCGFREASTRYLNVTMQIWISPRSSELGLKEQIVKLLKRTREDKCDIPGPVVEVREIDLPTVVHVVAHLR